MARIPLTICFRPLFQVLFPGVVSILCGIQVHSQSRGRIADFNIKIGVLPKGKLNAITDVNGIKVGHVTLVKSDSIRTGVTAILPHGGNLFQDAFWIFRDIVSQSVELQTELSYRLFGDSR